MRRGNGRGEPETRKGRQGLPARLRNPPGGRNARVMLLALFLDRTGSGLWAASSVLYLTFVTQLSAQQIGVLLGVAGVAGIAGSPLAGRLAGRFPVRPLLIGCHLLRLVTLVLVLLCSGFEALLPVIAVTYLGDRAAKMLEMLFATRTAGERRAAYQALSRSVANGGYALGAGIAAIGPAVGTSDAYRALILGNALSFVIAAALVWRTSEPRDKPIEVARFGSRGPGREAAARPQGHPVARPRLSHVRAAGHPDEPRRLHPQRRPAAVAGEPHLGAARPRPGLPDHQHRDGRGAADQRVGAGRGSAPGHPGGAAVRGHDVRVLCVRSWRRPPGVGPGRPRPSCSPRRWWSPWRS
ncbi:MFS transporter [Streptomyces sp. NPDC055157]